MRSIGSLTNEFTEKADPWETRSISSSLDIKPDLSMKITSPLLPISDLSLDEPACMPELIKNMVTVDHDLSGGVISSLYPENGDAFEGITPSSTKENPYKTTCEEVDDQEVYPEKLPSTIFLEMTPTTSSDLHSANKEEPQISVVDHYLPKKEETEITEPELGPCLEQSTSDSLRENPQPLPIPPSHEPKTVVVQEWLTQPDEASSTSEEEFSDDEPPLWEWQSTVPNNEASEIEEEYLSEDHKAEDATLSDSEEVSSESTYEMQPAAKEA